MSSLCNVQHGGSASFLLAGVPVCDFALNWCVLTVTGFGCNALVVVCVTVTAAYTHR